MKNKIGYIFMSTQISILSYCINTNLNTNLHTNNKKYVNTK